MLPRNIEGGPLISAQGQDKGVCHDIPTAPSTPAAARNVRGSRTLEAALSSGGGGSVRHRAPAWLAPTLSLLGTAARLRATRAPPPARAPALKLAIRLVRAAALCAGDRRVCCARARMSCTCVAVRCATLRCALTRCDSPCARCRQRCGCGVAPASPERVCRARTRVRNKPCRHSRAGRRRRRSSSARVPAPGACWKQRTVARALRVSK
jgi:hypothetical protein